MLLISQDLQVLHDQIVSKHKRAFYIANFNMAKGKPIHDNQNNHNPSICCFQFRCSVTENKTFYWFTTFTYLEIKKNNILFSLFFSYRFIRIVDNSA